MSKVVRYVVTHVSDKDRLRRLTFAMQGRFTYETRADAAIQLEVHRKDLGRVLSDSELPTLAVRPVACYEGHHDPMRYYFEDGKAWKCYARPAAAGKECGFVNEDGGIMYSGILCCESCGCTKKASDDRAPAQ